MKVCQPRWHYLKWITWHYWIYIFKNNSGLQNISCRLRGHPNGPIYYNPGGLEPDWHCIDCDEYLG
jgi:hypothetical protein